MYFVIISFVLSVGKNNVYGMEEGDRESKMLFKPMPSLRMRAAIVVAQEIKQKKIKLDDHKQCPDELCSFVQLLIDVNFNFVEALCLAMKNRGKYSYDDVRDCLTTGIDLNNSNVRDDVPLGCAIKSRSLVYAQLLLSAGALVDQKNKKGFTPIVIAVQSGYPEMVDFLLDHGANVHQKVMVRYETPLFSYALAKNNNINVLKVFLSRKIDVNEIDNQGKTPLMYKQLPFEIVKELIQRGAYVNNRNSLGVTSLALSIFNHTHKTTALLLANGADVNNVDNSGATPLIFSAIYNNYFASNELLACKALINVRDHQGMTALMYAAKYGNLTIVSTLLKHGADRTIRGYGGGTAEEIAIMMLAETENKETTFYKVFFHLGQQKDYKAIIRLLKQSNC